MSHYFVYNIFWYIKIVFCLSVSDLGSTWAAAILNSYEESLEVADFVMACTDCISVLIGGSTNLDSRTYFAFSDTYIPDSTAGMLCEMLS